MVDLCDIKSSIDQVLFPYQRLVEQSFRIGVAVSGGIDSMVLARGLFFWKQYYPLHTLHAITVDHQLRKESSEEALQVHEWLQPYTDSHDVVTWTDPQHQDFSLKNLQQKARKARYRLLHSWCVEKNLSFLFVAHHQDDQLETFWMRLSKGSGPIGLAGMDKISLLHHHAPSFKQSASIYLVRPLLSISRSDIEQIAQKHHIPFVQDPSNDSLKYERIQWRFKKKNLDHLGLKRQASANVMAKMRDCRHMIEYFVDQFFHDSIVCSQEYWTVDRKELIKLPIFLQIVIIQRILQQKTNRVHPTNYTTTRLLCKKFQKLTDHKKTTLGGCLFILNPQFIVIRLENRPQKTLVSND